MRLVFSCRSRSGALAPELARHEGSTPAFFLTWFREDCSFSRVLKGAENVLRGPAKVFDSFQAAQAYRSIEAPAEAEYSVSFDEVAITAPLSPCSIERIFGWAEETDQIR